MARKRVLHLIDTGGPGGAETVFAELASGIDPGRWQSVVVVPEIDWLHGDLVRRGIEPVVETSHGSFDQSYLRRIMSLIRRHRIDLVQAHLLTTAVYGSVAGRLQRVPVVCTFHGHVDIGAGSRMQNLKTRLMRSRRNRFVFVSRALEAALTDVLRVDATQRTVIYNGVDTSVFKPGDGGEERSRLGLRPDEFVLGAVGNVRPAKNYSGLLESCAVLAATGLAFRLVIAGDTRSDLFDGLMSQRERLGLEERVIFCGFRDDIAAFMRALDVFVLGSTSEGFSLATVQAMASGRAVVATRSGGPEEIVTHESDGVLVAPGDPIELANAILRIAADPALRQRLGARALLTTRDRFSLDQMVARYESLYDRTLSAVPEPIRS